METLRLEIENSVATLTLNRPKAMNAMNAALFTELYDALLECDQRADVKVILLTGAGAVFSAGGDVKLFASLGEANERTIAGHVERFHRSISLMRHSPKALIAAINGAAAGGGLSLALACDVVLCSDQALFYPAYTQLGISPDGGMSYMLPQLIGAKNALYHLWSGEPLSADQALALRLVQKVFPEQTLLTEARALAQKIAHGPQAAIAATKRLIQQGLNTSLESHLEEEARSFSQLATSEDFKEGVRAFMEKRAPLFKR